MTTIAYRDGVIAADTAVGQGGCIVAHAVKIGRSPSGVLVGSCGASGGARAIIEWVVAGMRGDPPKPATSSDDSMFAGMAFRPDGTVISLECDDYPAEVSGPYHALGSGQAIANGAMFAGASAIEAIAAAIAHDKHSAGHVLAFCHDSPALFRIRNPERLGTWR